MNRDFWRDAADGIRDILPPAIAAIPIGLLCGALGAAKGLSPAEMALMSMLVFAGGSQFAAIDLWAWPVPIATLVVSTLLVNSRHILMSLSLARRTGGFTWTQRLLGYAVMADENWAMAERRAASAGHLTPAYFLVMGAFFWLNWVVWATLGAVVGAVIGDPSRIGADFAFTALFIGLIVGFWRGHRSTATIGASLVAAALAYRFIGPPWHVAAGALAGIAAAWATAAPDAMREVEEGA
jgi:4-azaleucine resistance transporter AzlC